MTISIVLADPGAPVAMSITGDIFFDVLLNYSGTLIAAVLSVVLGLVLKPFAKQLWLKGAMQRVADAVKDGVMAVNQTWVDRIRIARQDGIVTAEELADAKKMAIEEAKVQLGKFFLDLLARVGGYDDASMDRMFATKVEAQVQRQNLIKSGALSPVSVDGSSTTPAPAPPRLPLPPPPPTSER